MVSFRPYRDGDAAGVAALLEESAPPVYRWKFHSLHGPGRDEPSRWRTEVAVGPSGDIRGAVTAAHHSVHRGQYILAVTVGPAHRRQGLGRVLVAEGLRMRTERLPMLVSFQEGDLAVAGLVRSVGGKVIQTAPNFVLDPVAMRDWIEAQPVPPGTTIGGLADAPSAELIEAGRDRYLWTHESWCFPPMSVPAVTAHAEATVAATRRELSSGAWRGGRLVALATVIDDPNGDLTLISETSRPDEPAGVELVAAVIAEALRRLAAAGVRRIELDGHVTDPHFHPVARTFRPVTGAGPLHVARVL